jgi:hypothetical protein
MYDGGKIVAGLVLFLAAVTSPIWYNVVTGKAEYKPEPKIVGQERECVAPKAWMAAMHMTILDEWRDSAVREGNRVYTASNGKTYNMSLSKTCMQCHPNKAEFCDQCHNYTSVKPYCWDCHIEPKEKK